MVHDVLIRRATLALAFAALVALAPAQPLCADVTPSVVIPGQTMILTLTGRSAAPLTVSGLIVGTINTGTPNGPVVTGFGCGGCFPQMLGNGQTINWSFPWPATFNQPLYYLRVDYWQGTGPIVTKWIPVHIAGGAPLLATTQNLRVNQTTNFAVSAPAFAGGIYVAAISGSTNVGFPVSNASFAVLDQQHPLFGLSWPVPVPGVFNGFLGVLDAAGATGAINIAMPNVPALAGTCVVLQVGIVPANGAAAVVTNSLSFVVAP
ncbi:MAG: hypothetical protein CMJ83_08865 [Planctomycetes bacterium]|nr:hypothetical protein [Planctomycetota bacterium]